MWSETHPLDGTQPPYSKALQYFTINEKHIGQEQLSSFSQSMHIFFFLLARGF